MSARELAAQGEATIRTIDKGLRAAAAAQDKKGYNVSLLDLEGKCSYTDALLIVSAHSERQATAIADGVIESLRKDLGQKPLFREDGGGWSVIDYGDLIVHVFQEDTRVYYDLDQLWADAPRVPVPLPESQLEAPSSPTRLAERRKRFSS